MSKIDEMSLLPEWKILARKIVGGVCSAEIRVRRVELLVLLGRVVTEVKLVLQQFDVLDASVDDLKLKLI